jgi:nitrite reductase/ring-hydroxylating ferredoxin subunit
MSSYAAEKQIAISKRNFENNTVKSFKVRIGTRVFRGLVVKENNKYFAYENICQHLPITLDLNGDNFFSHDKKYLQCHMHGAMYEIRTGLCIAGPCEGAKLVALELVEEDKHVVIKIPKVFGREE